MKIQPFQRPTPKTAAFASGKLQPAAGRVRLDPDNPISAAKPGSVPEVFVENEDALELSQAATPAVKQASKVVKPGGSLLITTGRAAMGAPDALEQQLREAGFQNFGLVVAERAYISAEKQLAPGLDTLNKQQSQMLLARASFADDAAPPEVIELGLFPRYSTEVRGRKVHLSPPFEARGYNTVIGYVETDNGSLRARTFYQSRSQGIWRSASGLMGRHILGKGPEGGFESSTNLPVEMQQHLQAVSRHGKRVTGEQEKLESAMHAPLEKLSLGEPSKFDKAITEEQFGDFSQREKSGDYQTIGSPQSFHYSSPSQKPEFKNAGESFVLDHPSRGKLQATSVPSSDGQYNYLFLQDSEERAWLGMVEKQSPVNEFGVSTTALREDSLTHPAIEYAVQAAPQYQGEVATWDTVYNNISKQNEVLPGYVDMTAYTHQLPPVKDFLVWKNR